MSKAMFINTYKYTTKKRGNDNQSDHLLLFVLGDSIFSLSHLYIVKMILSLTSAYFPDFINVDIC